MAVYKFTRQEFNKVVEEFLYTTLVNMFPLSKGMIDDTPIPEIGEDLSSHLGDYFFEAGAVTSVEVHTPTERPVTPQVGDKVRLEERDTETPLYGVITHREYEDLTIRVGDVDVYAPQIILDTTAEEGVDWFLLREELATDPL